MINKAVLIGRLTKDPEVRKTPNGASCLSYILAVDRGRKNEGQQDADFISCTAWNKLADTMSQYLHKGSLIGVEGRIQTRSYDNQQGQRVYVTEVYTENVQFLEPRHHDTKPSDTGMPTQIPPYYQTKAQQQASAYQQANSLYGGYYDEAPLQLAPDDLPF